MSPSFESLTVETEGDMKQRSSVTNRDIVMTWYLVDDLIQTILIRCTCGIVVDCA